MRMAVHSETDRNETRVAATPETVKKYVGLGAEVAVQAGAGRHAGIPDGEFEAAGALIAPSAEEAARDADIVLKVRRPGNGELKALKPGALVVGIMDPYGQTEALKALADAKVAASAMELMPRITRAQAMDVLSSQANLAGYRAVIDPKALRNVTTNSIVPSPREPDYPACGVSLSARRRNSIASDISACRMSPLLACSSSNIARSWPQCSAESRPQPRRQCASIWQRS
jgi:hypothetical protein